MSDNKKAAEVQPDDRAAEKIALENDGAQTLDNVPEDPDADEMEAEKDVINKQMDELNALNASLEDTKKQLEKEKKEYLFLMAEFDNFRKRTLKEKSEIIKNAAESTLKDLLPIVDDFDRAIEANAKSEDPAAIREGTELIYHKLRKFLESKGVKEIESTGTVFDPEIHEALAMVPTDDPEAKGKVIDTLTKGYTLGDKVIRHAKVAVGQ